MSLRLPIVISGKDADGATWSEPTETDDISTSGALFHLNQKVSAGDIIYLRSHHPDGTAVETNARVIRVSPAIYGTARIGVAIELPHDEWLRFFVSWIADDNFAVVEENEDAETENVENQF